MMLYIKNKQNKQKKNKKWIIEIGKGVKLLPCMWLTKWIQELRLNTEPGVNPSCNQL